MDGIQSIIGKYKIVGIIVAIIAVFVYFNRYQQSESEKGKAELEQKVLSQYGGDETEAVNDLREREKQLKQQHLSPAAPPSGSYASNENLPNIAGKWMDSNNAGAYYLIEQNGNQIAMTEYSQFLGESFVSASGVGYVDALGNATVNYQTLFGTTGQGAFRIRGNVLQGTFQDQNTGAVVQVMARK